MPGYKEFNLIYTGKINSKLSVNKYRSNRTGMQIVFVDIPGHRISGFIYLATESFDNAGLSHCVEHLVFQGSQGYPYKESLDKISVLSLCESTAYTRANCTTYEFSTISSTGFFQLLPVYLDSILHPLMTGSSYRTEIYSITPQGKESGVVYHELMADGRSDIEILEREVAKGMFPSDCNYHYCFGGTVEGLRESCIDKIRDYHSRYYMPKNLQLIVVGKVKAEEVLDVLSDFEEHINVQGDFKRPLIGELKPLESSKITNITFPRCSTDNKSIVEVGWRMLRNRNRLQVLAMKVIIQYIEGKIKINMPSRSTPTYYEEVQSNTVGYSDMAFTFRFTGVSFDSVDDIQEEFKDVVESLRDKTEPLSKRELRNIIREMLYECEVEMTDNPIETSYELLIADFLHGITNKDLKFRLNEMRTLKKLLSWYGKRWLRLLRRLTSGHTVTVIGKPSRKEMLKLIKEESNMRKELKTEILDIEEIEEISQPHPQGYFSKYITQRTDNLNHNSSKTSCNCKELKDNFDEDLDMACKFQLDDMETDEILIRFCVDVHDFPTEFLPYIKLYLNILFDKVKDYCKGILMEYTSNFGTRAEKYSSYILISFKVKRSCLAQGLNCFAKLLICDQFSTDMICSIACNEKEISNIEHEADAVVENLAEMKIFKAESIQYANLTINQQKVMRSLSYEEKATQVIPILKGIQEEMMIVKNMHIQMVADLIKLKNVLKGSSVSKFWKDHFFEKFANHTSTDQESLRRVKRGTASVMNICKVVPSIVGVNATGGEYLILVTKCVKGFVNENVPATRVFCKLMSARHCLMWRAIRGEGLAYEFSCEANFDLGLLFFRIGPSSDVFAAFNRSMEIFRSVVDDAITEEDLNSAKSRSLTDISISCETLELASEQALCCLRRNIPLDYNKDLMERVNAVNMNQLRRISEVYAKKLMDVEQSCIFVSCNRYKVKEMHKKFKMRLGCKVVARRTIDLFC